MKLLQVAEQNKKYYTKEFIHGFNTGAKTQYEADRKDAERRGMWLDGKCSNCGGHAPIWAVSKGYYKSNYCPYCGVKMDEVEE